MRMSWKLSKLPLEPSGFSFQRHHCWTLRNRISLSLTRPFQTWISLKLIRQKILQYKAEQGLAMEVDDLLFIQDYFKSIGRVPTETELKVLDTYWSDHCRHTTFETELKNIDFSASKFQKQLQRLMTSILPCVMSWDVPKNLKP